jgi:DNA-binding CsgD family transcriptional regulator
MGLSAVDRSRVGDAVHMLGGGHGPVRLAEFVPTMRDLLGLRLGLFYDLAFDDRARAARVVVVEPGADRDEVEGALRRMVDATVGDRWGFFDPIRPERAQRNRAVVLPWTAVAAANRRVLDRRASRLLPRLGVTASARRAVIDGLHHSQAQVFRQMPSWQSDQIRALVCDGPALIGWIGGISDGPATSRQQRLLAAIVPALRERLILERHVGDALVNQAALAAALDAIPGEAFIVRGLGAVVRAANARGRQALDAGRVGVRARLVDAIRRGPGGRGALVARLRAVGTGVHHLVVLGPAEPGLGERLVLAGARWRFTPRQREVLAHLARGRSNRTIATELGCAERTVEVHVHALLDRCGATSRAELVARFWSLE